MKNIPPECYNYNPVVFVPEYNESKKEKVSGKSDFSEFLNNEEKEEIEEWQKRKKDICRWQLLLFCLL